jgi:hypothetical protein
VVSKNGTEEEEEEEQLEIGLGADPKPESVAGPKAEEVREEGKILKPRDVAVGDIGIEEDEVKEEQSAVGRGQVQSQRHWPNQRVRPQR